MIERQPRPPATLYKNMDIWLEEDLWGHRLHKQSSRLIFLEFLTVMEACVRAGFTLQEPDTGVFQFYPYQRMYLRAILFRSDEAFRHVGKKSGQDAWNSWIEWMQANAEGIPQPDFHYLSTAFPIFENFASIVKLFRTTLVESVGQKHIYSRFIFPFGNAGLYEDINLTSEGNIERDYNNFGRTGELLYLMACRSAVASDLYPYLNKLIYSSHRWNKLLALLQPIQERPASNPRTMGYLPYRKHPMFNKFGEDWLAIFKLELPKYDAISHLMTLGIFHLFLYHLAIAHETAQHPEAGEHPYIICEIIAPKKTRVRELSHRNYQVNESLSQLAVTRYLDNIHRSAEWQTALHSPEPGAACRKLLIDQLRWDVDEHSASDPAMLFKELHEYAEKRHSDHVGSLHRIYGTGSGLVSSRGTKRLRYAPTDSFLKTLVATTVKSHMEYRQFLAHLYERYGLVIGEREFQLCVPTGDPERPQFIENAKRLEMRLNSLGMLRRLSDSCAYVRNPFATGSEL